MTLTVRALVDGNAPAARQLGFEAFGVPSSPPDEAASIRQPGRSWFGAFDGDTLAAQMSDRDYDSYFGGAALATAGIAGVTVAMEHRGRGALTPLFAATLAYARERGAVVSTLFPTAPRIYRRFGYEVVADFFTAEVATSALASVARPSEVRTRRATSADVEGIRSVYEVWASRQNGPLTRRGVSFPVTAEEYLAEFTGVSVAVDGSGAVLGYASWRRGGSYGEGAVLEVTDLLAVQADAYRALMLALGSFSTLVPQTRIDTSGEDLVRTFLPSNGWRVVDSSPYMLKVLDVVGALGARGYPGGFTGSLRFSLTGDFLPELNGGYVLEVGGGSGRCHRRGGEGRVFTPQGLALMFAGTQSSGNLRAAGHLSGGSQAEDSSWDALFGGQQAHIRDYF